MTAVATCGWAELKLTVKISVRYTPDFEDSEEEKARNIVH